MPSGAFRVWAWGIAVSNPVSKGDIYEREGSQLLFLLPCSLLMMTSHWALGPEW